jgi:hypothetical protein
MIMYNWDGQEALAYTGYMILISALVATFVFILYAYTPLGKMYVFIQIVVVSIMYTVIIENQLLVASSVSSYFTLSHTHGHSLLAHYQLWKV